MGKNLLCRLEALEKEERVHEQNELLSWEGALEYIEPVVFAYYLGGLESDEKEYVSEIEVDGLAEAFKRAINHPSNGNFYDALLRNDRSSLDKIFNDAYRRLFAKVGLDFYNDSPHELCDAFGTMINQLPKKWLNWLRSNLRENCSDLEIADSRLLSALILGSDR
jgi:hypothetical protein